MVTTTCILISFDTRLSFSNDHNQITMLRVLLLGFFIKQITSQDVTATTTSIASITAIRNTPPATGSTKLTTAGQKAIRFYIIIKNMIFTTELKNSYSTRYQKLALHVTQMIENSLSGTFKESFYNVTVVDFGRGSVVASFDVYMTTDVSNSALLTNIQTGYSMQTNPPLVISAYDIGLGSPCPTVETDGFCFKFFDVRLPWSQARSACLASGGDLACLDMDSAIVAHQHGLQTLLTTNRSRVQTQCSGGFQTVWWVGGTDQMHPNAWKWINSLQKIKTSRWLPQKPSVNSDNTDNSCMGVQYVPNPSGMTTEWDLYGWDNLPCNTSFCYVCEYYRFPFDKANSETSDTTATDYPGNIKNKVSGAAPTVSLFVIQAKTVIFASLSFAFVRSA